MAWAISGVGDLGRQALGDLFGVVAQRKLAAAVAGVGVAGRDVPDGGLGLDGDELGEVVDGVDGAGGVAYLPDDHGGDLDRVAVGVVDLGLR